MNNIICWARSSLNLLKKLRILFYISLKYNIFIKPNKSFFNYPNVKLRNQQVNSLGLNTSEEKLKTIRHFIYPEILEALEYYFDLIGYLQNYIHMYAQLVTPLQALKTSVL